MRVVQGWSSTLLDHAHSLDGVINPFPLMSTPSEGERKEQLVASCRITSPLEPTISISATYVVIIT